MAGEVTGGKSMKVKLICPACGHPIELNEAYEDYQGEVRCWGCRAVLEVKLRGVQLQTMKLNTGAANHLLAAGGASSAKESGSGRSGTGDGPDFRFNRGGLPSKEKASR
jgi:hypothetical protein